MVSRQGDLENLRFFLKKLTILLFQPPKLCHQVKADVRHPGIDISLTDCRLKKHQTCKTPDDLDKIDLENYSDYFTRSVVLICKEGVCKDYGAEFDCEWERTYLDDLESGDWCGCTSVTDTGGLITHIPLARNCALFSNVTCRQVCHSLLLFCLPI